MNRAWTRASIGMALVSGLALAGSGSLKGHVKVLGFGPLTKKMILYNEGSTAWTQCELRLPNNKHYKLPKLDAADQERILFSRFVQDGTAYDKPIDSVTVKCAEGEAKFTFSI